MSGKGNHFRTVAFGGFHKQDVLDYITSTNQENQVQNTDLKQKAEKVLQENAQLAERLEAAEAAKKKSAAECERLSETLAQRTAALEQAEKELAVLKAASVRLAELEQKLPKLEADSQAYSALKDHTATIELEAHRKAQETVEQAQMQAAKIRNELEGWLRRVQSGYQHLRTDLAATVTHLAGELERGQKALEEVAPAFKQHDEALNALMECERAEAGPKAPEPLPLDEQEKGAEDHG